MAKDVLLHVDQIADRSVVDGGLARRIGGGCGSDRSHRHLRLSRRDGCGFGDGRTDDRRLVGG